MIVLLDLLVLAVVIFLAFLLITQVFEPLVKGRKLFPAFKSNPIADKVEDVRDEVDSLKDKNAALKELNALEKERQRLEAEAEKLNADKE